jgi:hypothetical protein
MSGKDDKSSSHDEKHGHEDLETPALPTILKDGDARAALDVSLALPGMTGVHEELDTDEARAVKRKLDWRILPLLFS